METSELLSLIGALFALLVALVAVVYRIVDRRIERLESANNSAVLQSRLDAGGQDREAIWDQIGRSSEEGMRKTVHDSRNLVTRALSGVDDHDRRLDRLESKVFNGRGAER